MSQATAFASPTAQPKTLTSRGFEVAMAPDRVHVAQIRRIAVAHMRLWDVPGPQAQDVRLVASELVTNSVEHGRGTVVLRMWLAGGQLHVEVTDESPVRAQLQDADDEDLSGRGLFLVASLADAWGVSTDGYTTWATFNVTRESG